MLDILIIGGGGAGLSVALRAKEMKAKVALYLKSYPTRSQTSMAQGGINAVLSDDEEKINSHIKDTLSSSKGLGDEEMISFMCKEAKEAILWLDKIGVPFSRTEDGKIAQRRLGGAKDNRACYSQDYTGLKILHTLYDQCLKEDIEIHNEKFLLNFIVEEGEVFGATFLDMKSMQIESVYAKSIIVAGGGFGSLYWGFSTNSKHSTGDVIAAVLRAGGKLSNLEFVQFHPTSLKKSSILISESARGAGGVIINQKGERFVDELMTRDEVSRAVFEEIEKGNDVFLDIRELGEEFIEENLPQERKLSIFYEGVDPVFDLIPIKPAVHYTMGGIAVNRDLESSIKGLFAIGECSEAMTHGANRLGGNSLLELVAFSQKAVLNALSFAKKRGDFKIESNQENKDNNFKEAVYTLPNKIDFYEKREMLGKILYRNCGVFREEINLKAALSYVRQAQKELAFMGIDDKSRVYNTNFIDFVEFGNMLELSEALLVSAISRRESRGAHFRVDYPKSNKEYERRSVIWKENGVICGDFIRVGDEI